MKCNAVVENMLRQYSRETEDWLRSARRRWMALLATPCWYCVVFSIFCVPALAFMGSPQVLNPAEYLSRSGEYSLHVNPTDRHGRGAAEYRFSKRGKTVWTNRFPFTLWDVAVTDSGLIAGYAFTHGWDGFAEEGFTAGMGEFLIVILAPDGSVRMKESQARKTGAIHAPPSPLGLGVVVNETTESAIFRIFDYRKNQGNESWWTYDLLTGKRRSIVQPDTQTGDARSFRNIVAAATVPGTPLTLVHRWTWDSEKAGAVFALLDQTGKRVWGLTLDDDYSYPTDDDREDQIRELIWKGGGILEVRDDQRFDLYFVKNGLRSKFKVEKAGENQWKVVRTGQSPYVWKKPETDVRLYRTLTLKKLGEAKLSVGSTNRNHALRDLRAFEFDTTGDLCVFRAAGIGPPALLLISQEGVVKKELGFTVSHLPKGAVFSNPANIGKGRFVISASDRGVGATGRWFRADFDAGTITALTNVNSPSVDAVAGFPDGRFVALTTRHVKNTMIDGLFFFDDAGRPMWNKEQGGYGGKPDDLLSPEDVTRYGTNQFAVLDNIRKTIQVFDEKGRFIRFIDLREKWGRKPNYPTDISADQNGGFVIYDFNAKKTLVRTDAAGSVQIEMIPRFSDGRVFPVHDGVKRSPQGHLWTCDGNAILRLTESGVVNLVLGSQLNPSELSTPGLVHVGPNDRIYIADSRTHAVFVFDKVGRIIGRLDPAVTDLNQLSQVSQIAVSNDNEIFVQLGFSETKFLHFGPQYGRIGWKEIEVDPIVQKWFFQPDTNLCWIVGFNDVFLVRGLKDVVQRLSRHMDGRWLENPRSVAIAPDGSLAVVAPFQSGTVSVGIFSSNGTPLATFGVPDHLKYPSVAFNGDFVFLREEANVSIFQADGNLRGRIVLPREASEERLSGPFVAADGKETWFIDTGEMKLLRFKSPE